ncbi:MAG: DUF2608 domain-containing protein [Xanthomonadales bacterium]|nr:DUF2608 domain-containing protein [Xanthomonadales bacterium]
MPNLRFQLFVLIVTAALLQACASAPASAPGPPTSAAPVQQAAMAQNLVAATDDLAMVGDISLQMAERYGADRVLVVFDIDNTLLAMEQGLGSDQWYYWQKDLATMDPCSTALVQNLLKAQGALFYASAMRLTQPDAAAQVRRLQDARLPVIALTSRGPEYSLQTFRELRRNGISFWPSALPPARGYPERFIPAGGSREALYQDGVFLTAGQHKGAMLKALLDKTGTALPAVIVVADDKAENLEAIMETFGKSGAHVHAWRYSAEDPNVAALNTRQAAAQWQATLPALMILEEVFGPDNFDLPEPAGREGCESAAR